MNDWIEDDLYDISEQIPWPHVNKKGFFVDLTYFIKLLWNKLRGEKDD